MPQVSSKHPQKTGNSPTSSARLNKVSRPGWPEIIVGLVTLAVVAIAGGVLLTQLRLSPVVFGLGLAALAVVAPLAAFAAAVLLRIRSLSAFGVRRVSWRWLLVGVGAGVVAFVVKGLVVIAFTAITGNNSTPQTVYADGGSGGVLSLILATVFIGLLVPLSEELFFRGVLTNALLVNVVTAAQWIVLPSLVVPFAGIALFAYKAFRVPTKISGLHPQEDIKKEKHAEKHI